MLNWGQIVIYENVGTTIQKPLRSSTTLVLVNSEIICTSHLFSKNSVEILEMVQNKVSKTARTSLHGVFVDSCLTQ